MEAVSLYDFHATSDDELSFKKGSIVKVLNMDDDPNWWKAEQNGKEGLVPRNYIHLKPHPWHKGTMPRADAERTLLKQPNDGAFLVRNSETVPGEFSLSVKYGQTVQHFRVIRDSFGKYSIWVLKQDSINELINHHRTNSLSKEKELFLKDMADVDTYVAAFDFEPQEYGELKLRKGDIVSVTDKTDKNWWKGVSGGREGLFPATYIKKNDL